VDVVPEEFRAEALIEAIKDGSLAGRRVLIPRAKVAREVLPEKLREAGAEGRRAPRVRDRSLLRGEGGAGPGAGGGSIDCVTFTASSTVENFVGAFGAEESARLLAGARVVCIGPITADTARGFGLGVDAEAREYTIPGLIEAVVDLLATDPAQR
jgi:uroporphyrinogen III methyltransferase/synthase